MEALLSPLNVISWVIGILGVAFAVYKSINNPQVTLEKNQAINEEKDKGKATVLAQKETDSKALLLAQQVQWERDGNAKKFDDINKQITNLVAVNQNHLHTLETKIDGMGARMGSLEGSMIRLQTIIEERFPAK